MDRHKNLWVQRFNSRNNHQFECLEMVLHALVVWRILGIALAVYGFRHEFSNLWQSETKPNTIAKLVPD
jgi:hypothetical protein